jgi:hypothetical protein
MDATKIKEFLYQKIGQEEKIIDASFGFYFIAFTFNINKF